mgnify:CR=1 FL=1
MSTGSAPHGTHSEGPREGALGASGAGVRTWTNWAGNHAYRATRVHRPGSLEEVREIAARAPQLQVVGSRHSFTDIGDARELMSLEGMPPTIEVDRAAGTVTLAAGLTYARLAEALRPERVALHAMASLPHISVGGAVATATHGSGDAAGNLATAVTGLELVTSSGEVLTRSRADEDFAGLVVGLGALGVVTRVTLEVEPAYGVRQHVFDGLGWDALLSGFDAVMGAADSVSVFTLWGEAAGQVWLKDRVGAAPEEVRASLLGALPARDERHPIPGMDPVNCTPQLGAAGPWADRLPHFRAGFAPSAGAEIQSEYFVARRDAPAAIEALRALGGELRPLLQVSEIRTIAADALWMSPHHGRDSVGLHFTWVRDQPRVERALAAVEAALAPFDPRPHWGKLFLLGAADLQPRYPRAADFAALTRRVDPRGAFRNAWLERTVPA